MGVLGRLPRGVRDSRGFALVEWLMTLPAFLFVLLSVIQLGILLYDKVGLSAAAREAGRTGAITGSARDCEAAGREVVQAMLIGGGDVEIRCSASGGFMRAEVRYDAPLVAPWVVFGGRNPDGRLRMVSSTRFRLEGLGP